MAGTNWLKDPAVAAALADGDRSPLTIRDLAQGTWLTFLEPAQGLAEVIDGYGVAEAIGRPGAYGPAVGPARQ